MRLAAYAGTSAALAAGCLIKAFSERPNYYSATVYLSQSNACVLILTNLGLVCTVSFIYGLQRLLYGPLRPIEIEQLSEKAWYAVLDTLLAMPSLRDDVGGWLLITFVLLLAGKVWGWIAEGRVDILEQQPPANPKLFHARLSASLLISIAFDIYMCRYCLKSVMEDPRPGMMVIFTFEYAILTIFSIFTACRYGLAVYEAQIVATQTRQKIQERKGEIRAERLRIIREAGGDEATLVEPTDEDVDENEVDVPGWEEKRRWLFGLELATDFIKIIVYTVFFTISMTFIGIPMHVMRDVYMTVAAFTKRIQDYSNYRRATHDMNSRYPDATAEELNNENTCIVCREAMIPWATNAQGEGAGQPPPPTTNEGLRAKKLPCGHILHLRCLKAWLERQQTCPTCRRPVITQPAAQGGNAGGQAGLEDLLRGVQGNLDQHGQPGAGDPQARQGQQGQRRNRMRWLNMGPVRIGFYNGPAHQVQQALRAQAAGAAGAGGEAGPASQPAAQNMSANDHLRTAELRLLQEAHNLEVDRAQLATIRALEMELSRLRALRVTPGSTTATSAALNPSQLQVTAGLPPLPAAADIRLGHAAQQYQEMSIAPSASSGQQQQVLPPGMTLPDGWTLVPLQRTGDVQIQQHIHPPHVYQQHTVTLPPGSSLFQPGSSSTQATSQSSPPSSTQRAPSTGYRTATETAQSASAPLVPEPSAAVVPTRVATSTEASSVLSSRQADIPQQGNVQSVSEGPGPTQVQPSQSTPTWSFPESSSLAAPNNDDSSIQASESSTTSKAPTIEQQSNGHATEGSGKAKARSVEVEDVPDESDA
ncbi:hypothetical protein K461DRAFT_323224 [Myriangium duriaei CBS 260.36]|uniref:RING-type E3 ubiquitin transferase n=1 Tax=Myriangium duriaei CBS 260.36 TaxID=1168546 RepID=A0A9P4MKJ7_9PEZI|nr:hypothetical protein K461DRAFT_323224 [Myriangium duriaei CBS 260.36]